MLILPIEEQQERLEASGHRLKKASMAGLSAHCRVGEMHVRVKSPFSWAVLQHQPSTTLSLNIWQSSLAGCQKLAEPGQLYTMWLRIIPESALVRRNYGRRGSLASSKVHFLNPALTGAVARFSVTVQLATFDSPSVSH